MSGFVSIYLLATSAVFGQTVEPPPAFEAASVKLNTGSAPYYKDGPGQFVMRNYPLTILIYKAYGVAATHFPDRTGWTPSGWT